MLSGKGVIYSAQVQTILDLISESKAPVHVKLNDTLDCLNEETLLELLSDSEFTMEPVLEALSSYFSIPSSEPKLEILTLENYLKFYNAIFKNLKLLNQTSQLSLINSITSCISYFNEKYAKNLKNERDVLIWKESTAKIVEIYKEIFTFSINCQSYDNLKLFAEREEHVNESLIHFIAYKFVKMKNFEREKNINLCIIYLKLVIKLLLNHFKHQNDFLASKLTDLILILHVLSRNFIRYYQNEDSIIAFGCIFEFLDTIGESSKVIELKDHIPRLINEIFKMFNDHPNVFEMITDRNLCFGFDLIFFKSIQVKLDSHLQSSDFAAIFKKTISKHLAAGNIGILLTAENSNSLSLYEIYLKLISEDLKHIDLSNFSDWTKSEVLQLELFSKVVIQVTNDSFIDSLLQICGKSYFISNLKLHSQYMTLLKISLLSRSSDGLGGFIKRHIQSSSPMTIVKLCILSTFPFSLWRSLEKTEIISLVINELLFTWKFLISNESCIDLLAPILSALANILNEASDNFKKEDYKQIFILLTGSISILRTNTAMDPIIMKHKLAQSIQKLLRSLLMIRDDKVFDVLDYIRKLVCSSSNSCSTLFDTWKSLSLFSFIKHNRDSGLLNKTVSDRFDMLVPSLLSLSENLSPGVKIITQNYYLHSLQLYMRYTQDKNFYNKPAIRNETDALLNYVQDSSLSWKKGNFDANAEEALWKFLFNHSKKVSSNTLQTFSSVPVQIYSFIKGYSLSLSSSTLTLLQDDLCTLQKIIEDLSSRRDEAALLTLHQNLQKIFK